MISIISVKSGAPDIKKMLVAGNFDDTVSITSGLLEIEYGDLTPDQKTVFDDFVDNIIGTDTSVFIDNLPYNSQFSVDYITDLVTFIPEDREYDYSVLSAGSKGYIDDFNQLVLELFV
jgi:hypothetical protein